MPNTELPPGLEKKEDLVTVTFSLDATNLAWLDDLVKRTGHSRSEVARTIFDNARQTPSSKRAS